ncbi:substrate-binding domain-containing protein [Sandaracinus amylolyticus]|uniref:Serine/threonine protein kinase n=1 Tax=Sandaracinus amylolyticus TaxID=927083 RepID=A0A0F6W081_9BACT|nr:substrate-binding domain-containing protein [Sandaracinus amylolyticus]AKF03933.1 serine/threonine protein kinase [Sandaracinus amylolyticus]
MTKDALASHEGRHVGRYEILHRIASGGMGSVHLARAHGAAGFERLVAVKTLHPHLAHDDEFVAMFFDEARLAAQIRDPHVVATIDVLDEPDLLLVMEYVEGVHLGVLVRRAQEREGRLAAPVVLRIVLDALQGLAAAHDLRDASGRPLGLVHRDVSPQNVLVGLDGVARLTDFGVARAEARRATTREGTLKGKLGYMAPELSAGETADARADLFAMGVVLWEALIGRRLFDGESDAEIAIRVSTAPVATLSSIEPSLAALDAVMSRALARSRDARFGSAREMSDALERAASSLGIATRRDVGEAVARLARDLIDAVREGTSSAGSERIASRPDDVTRPVTTSAKRKRAATTSDPPRGPSSAGATSSVVVPPPKPSPVTWIALALSALALIVGMSLLVDRDAPVAREHGDAEPVVRTMHAPLAPDASAALVPTITVRARIDVEGRVIEAHVPMSRADLATWEARAVEAVRGWRFEPARRDGREVEAWTQLAVEFERGSALRGLVRVKGSDTLGGSLLPDVARAFREQHPGVRVDVEALGSSTAFVGLFDGSADLGASSRPISPVELAEAERLGIVLHELVIGWDGIAVIANPSAGIAHLTLDDLRAVYEGRVEDVGALGGAPGPLQVLSRPRESGTYAFFVERALAGHTPHPGALVVEHNEEIVRIVAQDRGALGYVGMGWLSPDVATVPLVASVGGAPVAPTRATIESGRYPLARTLLLYVREPVPPLALELVRFVLSDEGRRRIAAHGFVPVDRAPASLDALVAAPPGRAPLEPVRITFAQGASALDDAGRSALERVTETPGARFVVIGHAMEEDDVGSLSLARAESVRAHLIEQGVPPERIEVRAASDSQPLAARGTERGRRIGRRVDVFAVVSD